MTLSRLSRRRSSFSRTASWIAQLRQEMKEGDTALRQEMAQLRQDFDRRSGQLFWQMNIWFALLALLMTAYRFLH